MEYLLSRYRVGALDSKDSSEAGIPFRAPLSNSCSCNDISKFFKVPFYDLTSVEFHMVPTEPELLLPKFSKYIQSLMLLGTILKSTMEAIFA